MTVDIARPVYQKISEIAKENNRPIKDFVNELLLMNIEKDNFLKSYAPYLSKAGSHENSLYIKDHNVNRTAEVILKDHTLFCILDNSKNCIHVHFALALPELGKLNIKKPAAKKNISAA